MTQRQPPNHQLPQPLSRRRGAMVMEMVVSCAVLITIMTFVTTLCFQVNRLWRSSGHHRVAMSELSNQLDRLTLMSVDEVKEEFESLEASELCSRTLQDPVLSGEVVDDQLGQRIILSLNWRRLNPGKPVELSGWIVMDQREAGND